MSLTDNGVKVDWRSLDSLSALIYSDSQRAIAGAASIEIDKADTTSLLIEYAGYQPQYDGLARLIIRCLYKGAEKTFDAPVCDFVSTTAEATGITVINDPELDVHLTVTEVSTSILDAAIAAAFDGASEANTAAEAATTAAQSATNAAVNANNAASLARDAAQSVEAVKSATQAATKAANTAADSATTAANDASKAAQSATNAAGALAVIMQDAEDIISSADAAAVKATEAAIKANDAAINADEAFQSAEQSRQATFAASESARDADFQSKEAERDAAMQTISQEAQKLTELDALVGSKQDKTRIVAETEGNASYSIAPNRLTRLGTLASAVTLSLDTSKEESGVTNVYDIIFATPADAPSITWPEGISWVGGSAPAIAGGKTYEVSIMDNLATYGEF